jgi:hypothetical protein
MDLQPYFEELNGPSKTKNKIQIIHFLAPLVKDPKVMDVFCDAAISTTDHHLRTVVIDTLKENPAGASSRFSHTALHSNDPVKRKWALVNLSLMGCNDAPDAVINGLNDAHASVRKAAAMSTGLYQDKVVNNAFERYFEMNRFGLTVSCISNGIRKLREKIQFTQNDRTVKGPADTRQSELRMESGQ